jgi:hypothetical protein
VNASITTWGGTFVVITADFARARSRFLITTQPLENGHTLCEGIVFARRHRNPAVRLFVDHLVLGLRRYFTHGYLKDETSRLRQTRYNPSALIEADRAMAEYFDWLVALPQAASSQHPLPEPRHDATPARVLARDRVAVAPHVGDPG